MENYCNKTCKQAYLIKFLQRENEHRKCYN